MKTGNDIFSGIKTQEKPLESFSLTEITGENKINSVMNLYKNKKIFGKGLNKAYFKTFLKISLIRKGLNEENITGTNIENNKFHLYFDNGEKSTFSISDIHNIFIGKVLKGEKKVDIENRIINITNAVDAIYEDNKGVFANDDIDKDDVITSKLVRKYSLNEELLGKNLKDLKTLLDTEKEKISKVYKITGESSKLIEILQFEVDYYMGATDKTEGSAQHIAMSTEEIKEVVGPLVNKMSYKELFAYLKDLHRQMDDNVLHGNYKKSDMVKQLNQKLFDSLYDFAFERLKRENASNKDFIELIKVMSGRGVKISKNGEDFEYKSLEWDPVFRDMTKANKIMIHVLQKPGGIIEEIVKQKNGIDEVKIEDPELQWETPKSIVTKAKVVFGKFGKTQGKTGEQLLKEMNFNKIMLVDKAYNQLNLEEKIKIGALARMVKVLENTDPEEIKEDPSILMDNLKDTVEDSFKSINENLEKQFDRDNWFAGNNAKDLGLSGDMAEVFDLYQDINGNLLLDLSDDNWFNNFTWAGTATLALSIIAAGVAMGVLASGAPVLAILAAGAAAGAIGGLVANAIGKQGYDSFEEGAWDVLLTTSGDAALGALFFLGSIKIFAKAGIDILAEKLFSKINAIDATLFGGTEMLANALLIMPWVSAKLKNNFLENHFDTDKQNPKPISKKVIKKRKTHLTHAKLEQINYGA